MNRETTFSYNKDGRVQQVTKTTENGHLCNKEEFLGEVKEFMQNSKGMKTLQWSMAGVVIIQVMAFLVMWGSLTTTVKKDTAQLWDRTIPMVTENTRNIDKILEKLQVIRIIDTNK